MRVDAISIPAAANAASTAARATSSAPWSFSATLASSMRGRAPEDLQDQSVPAGTAAKSDSKVGAAARAKFGVKSGVSLNAKPAAKSNPNWDAKLAINSSTTPETQPLPPTYPLSASLLGTLLTTSLTTSPATSPTLAKIASTPPRLSSAQPSALMDDQILMSPTFPASGTANASSPQDRLGSTVTSAVPLAVTGRTGALPISNFSRALDVLHASSPAANAPVDAPVPTEAGSKSAELSSAISRSAADAAYSFSGVPTRASTAQAQFSTSSASVLPAPRVLASLTQASLAPVSPTPVSPVTTTAASIAPPSADSQFHAPIPASATILALDQSPIQSPSVPAALFSRAPLMPGELLTQPAPSSRLENSPVQPKEQPVYSPAHNPSLVAPKNSAFNTLSPMSSAPAPAPIPTLQSPIREINLAPITEEANAQQPAVLKASDSNVSGSIPPTSSAPAPASIPTLQSPVRDVNPAPVIEPTNAKQPAAAESGDSKVANATVGNSTPANFAPGEPVAAERAPTSGSAVLDTAPTQALSSDATITVATENIAGNNVSSLDSNSAHNSAAQAPTPASIVATTSDAPRNGKAGVSAQPVRAETPQTTGPYEKSEKKSSSAAPPNATALRTTLSHDVPATLASGKDSSATLAAPAPPASAPPPQVRVNAAPELPKIHQMLDSAPPTPSTPPIAPDPAAAAQMNAQMHVGIRTEAFGAVEIHTVVQQSQVGITVHADRDIAHWFSSELPGLESGLNKNHLNLTAVDFDNGRSGVQTATSFQHGHSQQHSSETLGSQSAALPDQNAASESTAADILTSDLSVGPAQNHVSIHV